MNPTIQKYLPVIGIVVTGGILLIMIIYKISTSTELGGDKKSYQKSLSLDKLYDEAGGNDPLSDSIMTSQIDLSTENNSCSFMVTYKGIRDRSVKCMKGCNDDESDDNSNFCKQFEYPGGDDQLQDTFLDQTYTRRRGSRKINEATENNNNNKIDCHNYPLRGDDKGNEIMKCSEGSDRATAECLGTAEEEGYSDQNYINDCFGYDSNEKKFYNCKTESDGSGNKILVQGEECDYQPQCGEMSGTNLNWVLETKKFMNEILGKCPSEELKTESNDTTTEEDGWDQRRSWLVLPIGFTVILLALLISFLIVHFIKKYTNKPAPISTNTAPTTSASTTSASTPPASTASAPASAS